MNTFKSQPTNTPKIRQDDEEDKPLTEIDIWNREFPIGTILKCKCTHCAKMIIQMITEDNRYPKSYCGKICQNRHRESLKKYKVNPLKCPTPQKASYYDGVSAHKHYQTIKTANPEMALSRPYGCVCGRYHLGRKSYKVVVNERIQ